MGASTRRGHAEGEGEVAEAVHHGQLLVEEVEGVWASWTRTSSMVYPSSPRVIFEEESVLHEARWRSLPKSIFSPWRRRWCARRGFRGR